MPSWIPGEDHLINFQKGDPYVKVDEGYARLPGAGYEALHPELEGLAPEDYPDISKLSILADVAPYSREYNKFRAVVEKQSRADAGLRAQYEQIVEQVRQTKESTLQVVRPGPSPPSKQKSSPRARPTPPRTPVPAQSPAPQAFKI